MDSVLIAYKYVSTVLRWTAGGDCVRRRITSSISFSGYNQYSFERQRPWIYLGLPLQSFDSMCFEDDGRLCMGSRNRGISHGGMKLRLTSYNNTHM